MTSTSTSSTTSTTRRRNLLSQSQGARVVFATDEWFAAAPNLLSDTEPVFASDTFSAQGKVMDGWETRRKRTPGHDWCLLRVAGFGSGSKVTLRELVVDTGYFTGNHVPRLRVEGTSVTNDDDDDWERSFPRGGGGQGTRATAAEIVTAERSYGRQTWHDLLPLTPLRPGYEDTRHHTFPLSPRQDDNTTAAVTHVRVNYYPDGGVARLRLWADLLVVTEDRGSPRHGDQDLHGLVDVACSDNGGREVGCSNRHYGVPANLLQPHAGVDMGDGWETARHPHRPAVLTLQQDGSGLCDFTGLDDWCVLALGRPVNVTTSSGVIQRVMIDTQHFKGNFPESVMIEACRQDHVHGVDEERELLCRRDHDRDVGWRTLLPRSKLGPDAAHVFRERDLCQDLAVRTAVTHVRVTVWPDGGLSRVRIYAGPREEDGGGGRRNEHTTRSHL